MVPNLSKATVLISGQISEGFEYRFEPFLLLISARCEELRNSFCLIYGKYFLVLGGCGVVWGSGNVLDRNMYLIFDDDSQESAR